MIQIFKHSNLVQLPSFLIFILLLVDCMELNENNSTILTEMFETNKSTSTMTNKCETGWYSFDNKCYFIHKDMAGINFHDAVIICQHWHRANVLTIRSESESNYIQREFFEKLQLKYSIWLGLLRVNETDFIWLDNQELLSTTKKNNGFINWASGEPENTTINEYCTVISSEHGNNRAKWYDVTCADLFTVVCEKYLNETENVEKSAPVEFNYWNIFEEMNHPTTEQQLFIRKLFQLIIGLYFIIFVYFFIKIYQLVKNRYQPEYRRQKDNNDDQLDRFTFFERILRLFTSISPKRKQFSNEKTISTENINRSFNTETSYV